MEENWQEYDDGKVIFSKMDLRLATLQKYNSRREYNSTFPHRFDDELTMFSFFSSFLETSESGTSTPEDLLNAVTSDNVERASYVLSCSVNVNTPLDTQNNDTGLHMAARRGLKAMAACLIDKGADLHALNTDLFTPLHCSILAADGSLGVATLLLERGAETHRQDIKGQTPLHLGVFMGFAGLFANKLMDYGADVNCQDYEGRVPLMWACHWGNIKLVETLVDRGADLDKVNCKGRTPLMYACREGHVDVVRFLLEYSASVDDVDKAGKTAADLASERGHLRVVQLIDDWQKPDPNPDTDTTPTR